MAQLDMPSEEGTALHGYDGIVEAARATPLVPKGLSVWELGTNEAPKPKFVDDYTKRTLDPGGIDKTSTTFVFATPRRFPKKREVEAEYRSKGEWGDVHIYDIDNIHEAFEAAPSVHVAFSEVIGKPVTEVQTIEDWWLRYSGAKSPALTEALVLAGRDDVAADLLRRIEAEQRLIFVAANSTDDMLAFVATTLLTSPAGLREDLLARTLIVKTPGALRYIDATSGLLILLPFDEELRREAELVRANQVVLHVPQDLPAHIVLPPIDTDKAESLLLEVTASSREARDLARAATRGLDAYRRVADGTAISPQWVAAANSRSVRRAFFAGRWHENRSGDVEAIARMMETSYDDFRQTASTAATSADPVVENVNDIWAMVEPSTAWPIFGTKMTATDLDSAEELVQTVLGAVDPSLELPAEERWKAAIYGKTPIHSADLRRGIATALAIVASGPEIRFPGGRTSTQWVDRVVWRLLDRANADPEGDLWASLSDVMPILAEAAPDVFIRALQVASEGATATIAQLFQDQGDGLSASSPHTGLLWAMERLAWSPDHLGLVAHALARLDQLDPGGRLSNRPAASLASIFRPWLPQTSVSSDTRLAVIDGLLRSWPTEGWRLLIRLLPDQTMIGTYNEKPQFRDWPSADPQVTNRELWSMLGELAHRAVQHAGTDASRWAELVGRLDELPKDGFNVLLGGLRSLDRSRLADDGAAQVWTALEELVRRHRAFSDAEWALPEEALAQLDECIEIFRPNDPVTSNLWLFTSHHPDLASTALREDFALHEAQLTELRKSAIETVVAAEGLDGVKRLAEGTDYAGFVGAALAQSSAQVDEGDVLALLDDGDPRMVDLAHGFASATGRSRDAAWFHLALIRLQGKPVAQARLLAVSDDLEWAWHLARELGSEVAGTYWTEFRTFGRGTDFLLVNEAAEELIEHGRPGAAASLMTLYVRKESRRVKPQLVVKSLEALVHGEAGADLLQLRSWDFEALLSYLREVDFDPDRVATLEWQLLPALGYRAQLPNLNAKLTRDPIFFVHVLSLVFRSTIDEEDREVAPNLAENAYRLLDSWRAVPGVDGSSVDADVLFDWVRRAREEATVVGRAEIADVYIGKLLAFSPADEDGTWPATPIRDLIEQVASSKVEEGLLTGLVNKRGVTMRDPLEGGAQEYKLAEQYRSWASGTANAWPRTSAILRSMADGYEADGRREDERAQRFGDERQG